MDRRYFFAQDDDSHWYLVPEDRREAWDAWMSRGGDWEDEFMAEANGYHTGGGIEGYSFTDPQEGK